MSARRLPKNIILKSTNKVFGTKKVDAPIEPKPISSELKRVLVPGFEDLSYFPVSLLQSPTKGRFVVSMVSAEPFKNIMFSRRYATSLYRRCLFQYCSNCHKRLKQQDEVASEHSRFISYCSMLCRQEQKPVDEVIGPSFEKFLTAVENSELFSDHDKSEDSFATLLLILKVFARRCSELKNREKRKPNYTKELLHLHKCYFDSGGFANEINYATILRLTNNKEALMKSERYNELVAIAAFFYQFYKGTGIMFGLDYDHVIDLVLRLESNGFKIRHGHGIFPTISLLNHSCDPNCRVIGSEDSLFIETKRDIKIGEELTIDYGSFDEESEKISTEKTKARCKEFIKREFHFDCGCE
jgi:hypothetical protein